MPSRSHAKNGNGKTKGNIKRGRAYRSQRAASRKKTNTFDSDTMMTKQLADVEKEKEKDRNEPVRGEDIFMSKSLKAVMQFNREQAKGSTGIKKDYKGSKKRRMLELQEEDKKKKDKVVEEKLQKKLTTLETKHTPQVIAAIKQTHDEMSKLTRKKQKSKLYFKMKRDKADMKKLNTQLTVITASDKSKRKRREENEDAKDTIKVLDDENDGILEEEDILDIDAIRNNDFDDEEDVDGYDEVGYGEQAQEPPKNLAKLSSKLEKRIENMKSKRSNQTTQEKLQERQNEILRQKVIENYKKNRQERKARKERGEREDENMSALRKFAANKTAL